MTTDKLVERVAREIYGDVPGRPWDDMPSIFRADYVMDARRVIAALRTPEFVLPLAEEMLRGKNVYAVELQTAAVALRDQRDELLELEDTLLDAYREAKGARCLPTRK